MELEKGLGLIYNIDKRRSHNGLPNPWLCKRRMKITIHRGTNQIGGCVTEIESNGYKVFIDFGEQLPGTKNDNNKLLQIDGLTCGDVSKSALFITHYHGDHIGKICDTVSGLPIFVGETALEIYKCLEKRLSYIPDKAEAET